MNTSLAQRQQVLVDQLEGEQEALAGLQLRLQKVDSELTDLAPQRQQFQLLGVICESLDQLNEMGAANLFWGEEGVPDDYQQRLSRSRELASGFNSELSSLDQARAELLGEIEHRQGNIGEIGYSLAEVTEELENANYDFVIEREGRDEKLFAAGLMPWSTSEEDRRRQRKILRIALVLMLIIGLVPAIWKLPPPDPNKKVEIPERLAKMVKKKVPPKPVKKREQPKKEEQKKDDTKVAKHKPKPKPEEVRKARAVAKTKGVLAHSSMLDDMMDDSALSNLGADARISGSHTSGGAPNNGAAGSRAMITASAGGSGGAVAAGTVSRGGVGNGDGSAITGSGVAVGSVKSDVAAVRQTDRPLSKGLGPSRTDEEIQIVFDRYKSALYRIYNRELRKNPALRGKMVLALTIQPDGSVSACRVKSTDLDSPALSAKIVARVKRFNFGAKDGVPATKILYPIDFLPAG
ncbi:MAG: AgmX/PglI C-terminal domain-containing protein [Alcanivorax sp.]|nr:AgmX/PglI C-terminal domain-containing protein [Alcanivorax sp.]